MPVYSICSADLVDVTSQFTVSLGDVFVNGRNGFNNERVQSPVSSQGLENKGTHVDGACVGRRGRD